MVNKVDRLRDEGEVRRPESVDHATNSAKGQFKVVEIIKFSQEEIFFFNQISLVEFGFV